MGKLQAVLDSMAWIAPYVPPAFGAILGLRWAQNQTKTQKVASVLFGFGVAICFAPAIAEVVGHLPERSPRIFVVISVLTAMLGMDILSGLMAVAKGFASSPLQTFKDWWAIWRNK